MNSPFLYQIHTPAVMEPGKTYPVIFALHGIGHNENNILALVEELKNDFILIGPRGHLSHRNGYAYYLLKGYGNPIRELFDQSMDMLENFIEYASHKYPIDPQKRYLLGFSQGAILSLSLSLVLGEKIRGAVAMNGYIPFFVKEEYPLQAIRNTSFFLSDGEHDPLFPPNIGQESYEYLVQQGASVTHKTYSAGHEVVEDNQRDLVEWLRQNAQVMV